MDRKTVIMDGTLHVWLVDDEEFVIAASRDDAVQVMREVKSEPAETYKYVLLDDSKPFTFTEEREPVTKTCGEWAKERGRGHFASLNY